MTLYTDTTSGTNACFGTEEDGPAFCGEPDVHYPVEDMDVASLWHVIAHGEVYDKECLEGLADELGFTDGYTLERMARKQVERMEAEAE